MSVTQEKEMYVNHKYKIHALNTTRTGHFSNDTFYQTEKEAFNRAKECVSKGCRAIVIYKAIMVVTPTQPEVDCHEVD